MKMLRFLERTCSSSEVSDDLQEWKSSLSRFNSFITLVLSYPVHIYMLQVLESILFFFSFCSCFYVIFFHFKYSLFIQIAFECHENSVQGDFGHTQSISQCFQVQLVTCCDLLVVSLLIWGIFHRFLCKDRLFS